MAELCASRRALLRATLAGTASGVLVSTPSVAMSNLSSSQSNNIKIQNAELIQSNGRWLFNCRANIELPSDIRLGLESGVPLQFIVSLKVRKPVRFWRDTVLLSAEHRFRLVYYELTRHYRVQAVEGEQSLNKRSLLSALDELGTVRQMDVTDWVQDSEQLADGAEPRIAVVSISLDQHALPLPLQPLFSSTWRLASEEFEWPLS